MNQKQNHLQLDNKKSRQWWENPMMWQIIIASVLAVIVGILIGPGSNNQNSIKYLIIPADLVINALKVLAYPLVFLILIHTFVSTKIEAKQIRKIVTQLLINTAVASLIGLLVFKLLHVQSIEGIRISSGFGQAEPVSVEKIEFVTFMKSLIPTSILKPITEGDKGIKSMIVVAISFGVALRAIKEEQKSQNKTDYLFVEQIIETLKKAIIYILKWVVNLLPLAIFGLLAKAIVSSGFGLFKSLGWFIIATVIAFFLQFCYYLIRLKLHSWVKPGDFVVKGREAFTTAFFTASGIATIPITNQALKSMSLRDDSVNFGSSLFVHFNKDGTALTLVMSALLFIPTSQTGNLSDFGRILIIVLASILASTIAVGVPNGGMAGLILVFALAGLDVNSFFALVLPIDWFIDMFRTVINVMGNMTTAALLEGKRKPSTT
jgi:Na+/H+-dicarboxylate symporter